MESIKETDLNLQREVVTTVPNTWLVEAVNPRTGGKKMIDIANYASVVANTLHPKGFSYFTEIVDGGSIDNKNLQTGFYVVQNSNVATLPDSFNGSYHGLINIQTSSGTLIQMLIQRTPLEFMIRSATSSGWSVWRRIDNFGYNTLEELASGVATSIGTNNMKSASLLPVGYLYPASAINNALIAVVSGTNAWITFIISYCSYNGGVPSVMLVNFQNSSKTANITALIGSINADLKYKVLDDGSVNIYLKKGNGSGRLSASFLGGTSGLNVSSIDESEIDETCVDFTKV